MAYCCRARTNFPRGRSSTTHGRRACSLAPSGPGRSRLDRQASACASKRHQPTFRLKVARQLQPRLPLREPENRNRAETPQPQRVWPPLLPQPGLCFGHSGDACPFIGVVRQSCVRFVSASCWPKLPPSTATARRWYARGVAPPSGSNAARKHRPVEACSPAFVIRPQEQRSGSRGVLSAAYLSGSASCARPRSCCAISARRDHTLAGSIWHGRVVQQAIKFIKPSSFWAYLTSANSLSFTWTMSAPDKH